MLTCVHGKLNYERCCHLVFHQRTVTLPPSVPLWNLGAATWRPISGTGSHTYFLAQFGTCVTWLCESVRQYTDVLVNYHNYRNMLGQPKNLQKHKYFNDSLILKNVWLCHCPNLVDFTTKFTYPFINFSKKTPARVILYNTWGWDMMTDNDSTCSHP